MAYNNGFPIGYQYYYPQQNVPQNAQNQPQNGIIWVQGEAGAKSYLVAPNQSVLLMDSEAEVFYVKTADASGMPMRLRKFAYKEMLDGPQSQPVKDFNPSQYVTRDELENRLKQLKLSHEEVVDE